MKHKTLKLGLLLASLCGLATAANIAYVAKTGPGTTGAGKEWPTTRFVVNGDCVTDNLTGLMWAKDGNLLGAGTWGSSTTAGTAQYKVAQMNTNSSATGYHLCGYSDWRLPNINELSSLVNYAATQSVSNPAAWLNNQGFTNVQADFYWSSTAFSASNAWLVGFLDGYSGFSDTGSAYYVWPVRGGQ